jgi:hypothetical protein
MSPSYTYPFMFQVQNGRAHMDAQDRAEIFIRVPGMPKGTLGELQKRHGGLTSKLNLSGSVEAGVAERRTMIETAITIITTHSKTSMRRVTARSVILAIYLCT